MTGLLNLQGDKRNQVAEFCGHRAREIGVVGQVPVVVIVSWVNTQVIRVDSIVIRSLGKTNTLTYIGLLDLSGREQSNGCIIRLL